MKRHSLGLRITERITRWVGSVASLILHSIFFIVCFVLVGVQVLDLNTMLLVLTTAVSLEAIYLAIFIQMTVNENTESLREVEEDIDEIQEDVEELGEDMDEIQEDLEEMTEDDEEEERREKEQSVTLEQLTAHVRQILADLEGLKKK
jgi:peptidoglycan hydrolase CwlO-like protein